MRTRKMFLGGLMVVMLAGLVGCGGGGDDETLLAEKPDNADLVVHDKLPFYEPDELVMPVNREVVFTVFNDGEKVHNVTIPGFAIDMDVQPKQSIDVKLPATSGPPRDAFYTFYCKYHQHEGEALRLKVSR